MLTQSLIFAFAFKYIETSLLNFSIFNIGKVVVTTGIASGLYFGLPLGIANSHSNKKELSYTVTILSYFALIIYSIFSNKLKFDDLFNIIASTYLILTLIILFIGRFTLPKKQLID